MGINAMHTVMGHLGDLMVIMEKVRASGWIRVKF